MTNEILDTTNKLIKPEDISKSDDAVIRQLSDNLQDITPKDIDSMCDNMEEADNSLNKMKGDRDAVLKYIVDNYVTRESANISGISGDIISIKLPNYGDFPGFEGKYFISHKPFELYRDICNLYRESDFYGWESSGLVRGNPIPHILEQCASMEEVLDLANAIKGYMKSFEIDEDIKDEGHRQSGMNLSSGICHCIAKIIGLDENQGCCYYWLRDLSFFNRGNKKGNTFTNFYVGSDSCGFRGIFEIGDDGYLFWNLGKRSDLSTAEGLNKHNLSGDDYSIVEMQNNKLG